MKTSGWLLRAGLAASVVCWGACRDDAPADTAPETTGDTTRDTAGATEVAPEIAPDSEPDTEAEVAPDSEPDTEAEVAPDTDTPTETDSDSDSEVGPPTLAGPCDPAERFGRFSVEAQRQWAIVSGQVADGIVPNAVLSEAAKDGDCRLMRKQNPVCDPPCSPGEACGLDGACVPYPLNYDVGTVAIAGLKGPVSMKARVPALDYSFTALPNPPFDPGAVVRLTNAGGPVSLTLAGIGFTPIVPVGDTWSLRHGEALPIAWDAPAAPTNEADAATAVTRVELQILVDQHGTSPLFLTCDFADTGTGEISATIVDALLDAGISGFPSGKLARGTTDSQTLPDAGCVELRVTSPRILAVRVAGHVPCTKQADCPSGLTCNIPNETCE